MLHTIIKRLKICIDVYIEIREVDRYTWIFTSRIFTLALEITFLINKYFFLQMAQELLSQSRKLNKRGCPNKSWQVKNFLKKKITEDAYQEPHSTYLSGTNFRAFRGFFREIFNFVGTAKINARKKN